MTPKTSCAGEIDGGALTEGRRGHVICGTWSPFGIQTDLGRYHGGEHLVPQGNASLVRREGEGPKAR